MQGYRAQHRPINCANESRDCGGLVHVGLKGKVADQMCERLDGLDRVIDGRVCGDVESKP